MSFFDTVRDHLSDSEPVVWECRNCGTSVESDTERCPGCGSEEIVRYNVA